MQQTTRQAEMFAQPCREKLQALGNWAKKDGIECFRIYDRDIPELPFALDYIRTSRPFAGVQPPVTDVRAQREWRTAMHAAAAQALGHSAATGRAEAAPRPESRRPVPQTGSARREDFVVGEGGHRFIVNLTDYLDTGLFLDHRQTRALVGNAWPPAGASSTCSAIREASASMPRAGGAQPRPASTFPIPIWTGPGATSNSTAWTRAPSAGAGRRAPLSRGRSARRKTATT